MSQAREFVGEIRGGKFVPADAPARLVYLASLEGKRVIETLQTEKQRRSLAQNRRWWSLVVPVAAEILSAGRPLPLSKDETHWLLKGAFIGWEDTPLGKVPKSSRTLTTAEFAAFNQRVEEWMATAHGIALPEVGEEL